MGDIFVEDADSLEDQTLQEHDRIYHPKGYHQGDTCKFRDRIATETEADKADIENSDSVSSEGSIDKDSSKKSIVATKDNSALKVVANKVKNYIKGVEVQISDKPFSPNGDPNERKAIKLREMKRWQALLQDYLSGRLVKTDNKGNVVGDDTYNNHLVLEHTPTILQKFGVKDMPIKVSGQVLGKILGLLPNREGIYHKTPWNEIARWQLEFDKPIAIFSHEKNPNEYVLLTRMVDRLATDHDRRPKPTNDIIALVLDAKNHEGEPMDAHFVATAYGQYQDKFKDWVNKGYLRYLNKELLNSKASWLKGMLPSDDALEKQGVKTEKDFPDAQMGKILADESPDPNTRMFLDDEGVVVGTYNRKTNKVTLYPGADADTIGHELCGHATWQYAEQQAKKGDDRLLKKMNEVVDAPESKPVWNEVAANYDGENKEVQREEVWAHVIGHKTSKAIDEIKKEERGRKWYKKFWGVVKDAWKGLTAAAGLNRVKTDNIEKMSPEEFSDYMVKQMTEGKTLGVVEKGRDAGERKSVSNVYTGSATNYDKPSLKFVGSAGAGKLASSGGEMGYGIYGTTIRPRAETYADYQKEAKGSNLTQLLDQTFFTDGDRFVEYDSPCKEEDLENIFAKAKGYGVSIGEESWETSDGTKVTQVIGAKGNKKNGMYYKEGASANAPSYGDIYKALLELLTPQEVSKLFVESGISGCRRPKKFVERDDEGEVIREENGYDYVSYRDDNIRVDGKYVNGKKIYDYNELMKHLHSNKDPLEVLSRISKLETAEEMAAEFKRIIESETAK